MQFCTVLNIMTYGWFKLWVILVTYRVLTHGTSLGTNSWNNASGCSTVHRLIGRHVLLIWREQPNSQFLKNAIILTSPSSFLHRFLEHKMKHSDLIWLWARVKLWRRIFRSAESDNNNEVPGSYHLFCPYRESSFWPTLYLLCFDV